jgi:hypothetical protein
MKKLFFVALLVSLSLLAGCKDETVNEEIVENESVESEVESTEEVVTTHFVNKAPLTGLGVEQPIDHRIVAVQINNHPLARPQSGVSFADIVYELLVESDATRFLALYQSEMPENIGPVRSARDYFVNLAKDLQAFYIAHGYSPGALAILDSGTIDHLNGMKYDGTYFKRSTSRKAPHNSYITGENIYAAAEKIGVNLKQQQGTALSFYDSIEDVEYGNRAKSIQMNYYGANSSSNSTYTYDEDTQTYLKAYGSKPLLDELTNTQIAISNVIFMEAPHRTIDSEGRREITLSESGKAYVFQAGVMREVNWVNKNGLLTAIETNGSAVKLVPGKTWIHVVPTSPGLVQAVLYSE